MNVRLYFNRWYVGFTDIKIFYDQLNSNESCPRIYSISILPRPPNSLKRIARILIGIDMFFYNRRIYNFSYLGHCYLKINFSIKNIDLTKI